MLTIDEVSDRLDPIGSDLVEAHLEAWRLWRRFQSEATEFALPLTNSERAGFVHRHVCRQVGLRLGPKGLKVNDALDFSSLAVGSDLLIRFKFVRDGHPSNVQTDQQRRLARQQYTEEMMLRLEPEGVSEPPTLITLGYQLDPKEEEISRVIALRECIGYEPAQYDLYPVIAVAEPLVFPGMTDARPARVRSTKRVSKEAESGESS